MGVTGKQNDSVGHIKLCAQRAATAGLVALSLFGCGGDRYPFSGTHTPSVFAVREVQPVPLGTTYDMSHPISISRGRSPNGNRITVATTQVTVNVPNQPPQDFMAFCQTHDCDVGFTWIDYHQVSFAPADEIIYVINPAWDPNSMMDEDRNQPRYIGRVMRGVRLPNGRIADVVASVDPSQTGAAQDPAWIPRRINGELDILFTLVVNEDGSPTLQPSDPATISHLPEWDALCTAIPVHTIPIENHLSVTTIAIRGRRPTAGRPEE
ncbi:hypothetical protein KKF81_03730 [Candidatus Micrarchaeota archaeon]|nr:hypothetical protein [Candidatus Micrarchaeota archaeon]MBU1166035.1 hypothetical protein [Candidatus Micrarchaeota archaeon]MBU1886350.1 hypothetical protein [Candidatus Micrarchaeota archaeon]